MSISLLIASCNQTTKTKAPEEQTVTKRNRTDTIVFMGIRLGIPNEKTGIIIDSSNQITREALPDGFNRYIGSSNNSIFENPEERTIHTFYTHIIDKKDESHDAWGIIKSDCDYVTTIHIIIPSCKDGLYDKIRELYIDRYGEPDQEYNEGVNSYLENSGCFWEFSNNQRITLNKCEYSGTAGYVGGIDWSSKFKAFERVEVGYQDLKALQRLKQKEDKAEETRLQAEKERLNANRKAREDQQI